MSHNYRDLENQQKFREGIWKDTTLSQIVRKLDKVAKRHDLTVFGSHNGTDTDLEIAEGEQTFLRLTLNRQTGRLSFGVIIMAEEENEH